MARIGPLLLRNWLSIAGVILTTLSAVLFLTIFFADLLGVHTNPYIDIVFFLIMPALFLVGLVLIPIGMWRERRRIAAGRPAARWPMLDLNDPSRRRLMLVVVLLTIANAVILSLGAYKGVELMDSPQFCGEVCHEVMEPEYTAYHDGPHSRVPCVGCHIGPGAPYLVKSKVDGTRQVLAVLRNSHARPIPVPVHTLRPARVVCEQCHWPEKFHGDKVIAIREYADDEQNTETATTLQLHVGGGSEKLGIATGIHWHVHPDNQIEYISTDATREVIPYVRLRDRSGDVREYVTPGTTEEQLARGERRVMDCMDCHNRPAHTFDPTPERAIDSALALGIIPKNLPFVRREAVAALKGEYTSRDAALAAIATRLREHYRNSGGADAGLVDRAVQGTQNAWARNVFPAMKVTWGTYANHISHVESPGCFRCHDDEHKSKDGKVISQDCELCHKQVE
jgi:nitrate/TMAO reductase-like tetraheme cytochrome c subunit